MTNNPGNSDKWLALLSESVRAFRDRFGSRWLIGVSGGSDSVALLRILHTLAPGLELSLVVAHLDHNMRGESSRKDAEFVELLANELGLTFALGSWRPKRQAHFESDARRARYQWLATEARNYNATVVAVAHNREDQAETVLHRILRGTGLRGLAGMSSNRQLAEGITLVRPLLESSKAELRRYLEGLHQPWREDSSNADLARTRSRLRHDLIPKLASEYNPEIVVSLQRLARLTSSALGEIDRQVEDLCRVLVSKDESDRLQIDRQGLTQLGEYLQLETLRSVWRKAGWPEAAMTETRWRQLLEWATGAEGIHDVGVQVRVQILGDNVILFRCEPDTINDQTMDSNNLSIPGTTIIPNGSIDIEVRYEVAMSLPRQERGVEIVDLDQIALPLELAYPSPGDRFDPLGLQLGSMPLVDFLRGRRVPRPQRSSLILVKDQIGIVWVIGHRISHRVRVSESTQRVAILRWRPV